MSTHDRPWQRPGAFSYARRRLRSIVRPPIEVYAAPDTMITEADIPVTMVDGVVLRLNVYRPAREGPFPVIMSASPYGKDALPQRKGRKWRFNPQYRVMNQSVPVRFSDRTSWEAPDPAWWTDHGYVVINADTRGGGHSDGTGDLLSDQEAHDIAQLIAWAASQPWCDGTVGMIGVSYLAISQYKVAALHPPALKAICPWEGFTDPYRDFFTSGGVVENGFARIWLFLTKRQVRLRTDIGAMRGRHPLRDEWWESLTPDLSEITVPMLVCTSFSDNNLHSTGSMRAFQDSASDHRFAFAHRGPKWATFYGDDANAAQLAFFDRYLKHKNVAEPPRMRLEVRETRDKIAEIRSEDEWPLARTSWCTLHLAGQGELTADVPAPSEVTFDLRRNAARFEYRFTQDAEISGPMVLRLAVSSTRTDDPRLFVGVEKWAGTQYVPFEGSYGYGRDRVASGRLRVALRDLDPTLSRPHQPVHAFTTLRLLEPGEVVDVEIALTSSATLFRSGDTLRLLIGGRYLEPRNPLNGHFPAHYIPSPRGTATIHWSPERLSTLEIPVIPRD